MRVLARVVSESVDRLDQSSIVRRVQDLAPHLERGVLCSVRGQRRVGHRSVRRRVDASRRRGRLRRSPRRRNPPSEVRRSPGPRATSRRLARPGVPHATSPRRPGGSCPAPRHAACRAWLQPGRARGCTRRSAPARTLAQQVARTHRDDDVASATGQGGPSPTCCPCVHLAAAAGSAGQGPALGRRRRHYRLHPPGMRCSSVTIWRQHGDGGCGCPHPTRHVHERSLPAGM